jgi:hypothetical protein
MNGQEVRSSDGTQLAEKLVRRLGKPDAVRDWNGTTFDYKIEDGRIFTIAIAKDERAWAGLKTDLKANVGKVITLSGIYMGPGKVANYIYTNDGQQVDINRFEKGGIFPEEMRFGDRITLTGTLHFYPGVDSGSPFRTSSPGGFHVETPTVTLESSSK